MRKEDEKNERIIRSLAKLDDNRKCVNCGSLGPQFVCTSFSTFVCMSCSGVHREFTHRVKSISMSKFSAEEVAALQSGGNQRAREIYFRNWDPKRHPVPDSSFPEKLRDFIKAVYVDQAFSSNKPPRPVSQAADNNDARRSVSRNSFSYHSSSSFDERRKPSFVDEVHHQRAKSDDRSPRRHRDFNSAYSPPVRSMREILGDDLPTLRIEPTPPSPLQADTRKDPHISRFGSFVGEGGSSSTNNSPAAATVYKRANSDSGIDFNTNNAESNLANLPPQQPLIANTGWATFDVPAAAAAPVAAIEVSSEDSSAHQWHIPYSPLQQVQQYQQQQQQIYPEQDVEASNVRQRLPEVKMDLFAPFNTFFPVATPSFIPEQPVPPKSTNPFDFPDDDLQQPVNPIPLPVMPVPWLNSEIEYVLHQPSSSSSSSWSPFYQADQPAPSLQKASSRNPFDD